MGVRFVYEEEYHKETDEPQREIRASYRDIIQFLESPLWADIKDRIAVDMDSAAHDTINAGSFDEKEYHKGRFDAYQNILQRIPMLKDTKKEEMDDDG